MSNDTLYSAKLGATFFFPSKHSQSCCSQQSSFHSSYYSSLCFLAPNLRRKTRRRAMNTPSVWTNHTLWRQRRRWKSTRTGYCLSTLQRQKSTPLMWSNTRLVSFARRFVCVFMFVNSDFRISEFQSLFMGVYKDFRNDRGKEKNMRLSAESIFIFLKAQNDTACALEKLMRGLVKRNRTNAHILTLSPSHCGRAWISSSYERLPRCPQQPG